MSKTRVSLGLIASTAVVAETIDTGTILSSALNFACLRFEVIGICLWLVCTPFGCEIETSPKIGQYNPDLVVSSFNGLAGNPWLEMRAVLAAIETSGAAAALSVLGGPLPNRFGGGVRTEGTSGRSTHEHANHANLIFKEVDGIGHPAAGRFYCPSAATPFQPYFLSALDAIAWRWSIPEGVYPQAWMPGWREIGEWPLNSWGAVYPRAGFVIQAEDPKAAAVTAQRAGDVVTRTGQPHVYIPLDSNGTTERSDRLVWLPPPLAERKAETGTWQMLVPHLATACAVFGENDALSVSSWADGKVSTSGDYVFTLWRPYRCCEIEGAYIGSIDFLSYP